MPRKYPQSGEQAQARKHLLSLLLPPKDMGAVEILQDPYNHKLLEKFGKITEKQKIDFLRNEKRSHSNKIYGKKTTIKKEEKHKANNFIKIKKTKTTIKKENKLENIIKTTETETEKQEIKEIHFNTDQSRKFNQIAEDFNKKLEALIKKEKIVYYKEDESGKIVKDQDGKSIINKHLSDSIADYQAVIIHKMLINLKDEVNDFTEKHKQSSFERGKDLLFQLDILYNKALKIESKDMERFKELTEIIFNLQKSLNVNSQTDRIIFENTQARKEIENKEPKIIENDLTEDEALQELKSLEEQDRELKELENSLINT